MPQMTEETRAFRAFEKNISVMEFSPRAFAFMLGMATPRIQQRAWDIFRAIVVEFAEYNAKGHVFDENVRAMEEAARLRPHLD